MVRSWKILRIIEQKGEFMVRKDQPLANKLQRMTEVGKVELRRTVGDVLIYGKPQKGE